LKLLEKIKKEWTRRKKWLTKKTLFNCFYVSVGILIIAWIFEIAEELIQTVKTLTYPSGFVLSFFLMLITVLVSTGFFVFYGFIYPDLMETVFKMLGFEVQKEKEEKNDKDTNLQESPCEE